MIRDRAFAFALGVTASLSIVSLANAADMPAAAQDAAVKFAAAPSYVSDAKVADYSVSDDGKSFQVAFNSLQLGEKGGVLPTQVVSRTYSIVVPFSTTNPDLTIPIKLIGYGILDPGAHATTIISINGQTATVVFEPANKDESDLATLDFKTHGATEARITAVLVVAHDTGSTAGGFISLSTLGADTFVPPSK